MTPRVWSEIVAAHQDAVDAIQAAFADRGSAAGAGAPRPVVRSTPDLAALNGRLYRRLDELRVAIAPEIGDESALLVLQPLTFLLDEDVEKRLTAGWLADPPEWPQLQRFHRGEGNGGDEFYERVKILARKQGGSPLLVGLYLYCLRAGFQGRLYDDPAAIERVKADLVRAMDVPPLAARATEPVTFRQPRPRWHFVLAAAGAVVAFEIVLLALARAM